jgi:hypothetical protein
MGNFEFSIIPEKMVMTTKKYYLYIKMSLSRINFKCQKPLNDIDFRADPEPYMVQSMVHGCKVHFFEYRPPPRQG